MLGKVSHSALGARASSINTKKPRRMYLLRSSEEDRLCEAESDGRADVEGIGRSELHNVWGATRVIHGLDVGKKLYQRGFCLPSAGESEYQPLTWKFCPHSNFFVGRLRRKGVKNKSVELHADTTSRLSCRRGSALLVNFLVPTWTWG